MGRDSKPSSFSLRKNFKYMGMVFSSPKSLIERFREESSLLYGLVPLAIFVGIYEILYVLDIVFQPSLETPFPRLIPIPESEYPVFRLFYALFFNVANYLVFVGVVYLFFRRFQITKIRTRGVLNFFMLIWNTVGLMAALGDLIYFFWASWVFALIHFLCAMVDITYVSVYIHKHAGISKGKAVIISVTGVMAFAFLRVFFLV